MVRVGAYAAAIVLAAAFSAGVERAYAGDGPSGGEDTHFLYFAGADLWRNGGFLHGGVLWSPEGLEHDGFALKAMFGGGIYHYISGALGNADVMGRQLSAAILPGWRFIRDKLTVTVFAGLDFQNHRLTPDDPSAGLRGSYAGLRTGFDLWFEPTGHDHGRGRRLRLDGRPELQRPPRLRVAAVRPSLCRTRGPGLSADGNYRQFRAGAHVTGFQTETWEWSGGAGFVDDSDRHNGIYGKIGVLTRR